MGFAENLKDLLIDKGITLKELANNTGLKLNSLYYNLKNDVPPDAEIAIVLSEYFNCSVNYLLGLDDKINFKQIKTNKSFIENYEYLLKLNKTNNSRVCKQLNINRNAIYKWRRGKTPRMFNLIEMAKYFNTTIDFLLGLTDDPS